MFHIPAHKNTDHPAAQIRNGQLQADPQATQTRRQELYGVKARRADQAVREGIRRRQQAQEMVRKAMREVQAG